MEKSIPLKAGENTRVSVQCKSFLLLNTGVAAYVNLSVEFTGNMQPESMGNRVRGFKMRGADASVLMETMVLTAPVDCTIQVLTSNQNIDFNFADGANVVATIDSGQLPLPVDTLRGTPGAPMYVSGVTYTDAPAVTLTDIAAIAVTSAGAALAAANPTRKSLRFANIGVDPVAIGFTGITWAKRCIVIQPGDLWIEERAANLAWAAITDAAKTASVTVQEVSV